LNPLGGFVFVLGQDLSAWIELKCLGVSTEQILGSEVTRATEAQRVTTNKPGV
jgi:hypothetical protein